MQSMGEKTAIQIAKEYIHNQNSKQPISIDTREILDENPIEFLNYWCFKSYYEDLNPMRGDGIKLSSVYPFYLLSKRQKKSLWQIGKNMMN